MPRLTRPSDADLQRIADGSQRAAVSYLEIGATRQATMPSGYRVDHYERALGVGEDIFERAVDALRRWDAQTGAGIRVIPRGARVEEGETVLFVLRAFGLWTIAPCRVVYVSEEADRFSFGYGTLPGHPECGEVAMTVSRDDSGAVTATIDSFSRTVALLPRAVLPITRSLQTRVTSRYLEALAVSASSAAA